MTGESPVAFSEPGSDEYPDDRIPSRTLADLRHQLEGREYDGDLDPMRLGKRMYGLGIRPDHSAVRDGGRAGTSQRGFTFRRGGTYVPAWADAFERYGLPVNDENTRSTRSTRRTRRTRRTVADVDIQVRGCDG